MYFLGAVKSCPNPVIQLRTLSRTVCLPSVRAFWFLEIILRTHTSYSLSQVCLIHTCFCPFQPIGLQRGGVLPIHCCYENATGSIPTCNIRNGQKRGMLCQENLLLPWLSRGPSGGPCLSVSTWARQQGFPPCSPGTQMHPPHLGLPLTLTLPRLTICHHLPVKMVTSSGQHSNGM